MNSDTSTWADSCGYYPTLSHLAELLKHSAHGRVLMVGDDPVDPGVSIDLGWIEPEQRAGLARGTYWKRQGGVVEALIVLEGPIDQAFAANLTDAPDDHPALVAMLWLDHWWPEALPIPKPQYRVNESVIYAPDQRDVTIKARWPHAHGWSYRVVLNAALHTVAGDLLVPIKSSLAATDWVTDEPAAVVEFGATITRRKLTSRLTDTLFSYGASRTIFRPYQFKPVLRYLDSAVAGLLVADEVGLGKTISAGLYWTELAARGNADRVLVVCPSALVGKWQAEMANRFNLELKELTGESLRDLVADTSGDRLPMRFAYVCSLERLRVFGGLTELNDAGFGVDLVIVDEAHQMRNVGTASNALGTYLSMWAAQLLFLSATPLSLGDRDLFNLMHLLSPADVETQADLDLRLEHHREWSLLSRSLLDPSIPNTQRAQWLRELGRTGIGRARRDLSAFGQLEALFRKPALANADVPRARNALSQLHGLQDLITRTRKVEVEESKPVRDARRIDVTWTDDEWAFYEGFQDWVGGICRREGKPVGFAMQMPLRQAGSCLPVLAKRLGRSFDHNEDFSLASRVRSMLDDEVPPTGLQGLSRRLAGVDSKFDSFLPELRKLMRAGKQVLLFTFSRGTLAYLEQRLRPEFRPAVLHGGVRKEDRDTVMREFREGHHRLVLATRVASEGLDFEFCSVIVNYDLPWNPMEVEQRIGRIDRIGQTEEKIQIWNFHTPGTIETRIVGRLLERIGIFEHAIGELEPIVGEHFDNAIKAALDFSLSRPEREVELRRAEAALEQNAIEQARITENASRMQAEEWFSLDDVQRRIDRGRFVGPLELASLVSQWAADERGHATIDKAERTMTVRFSRQLQNAVVAWRRQAGVSGTEVTRVERAGRELVDYTVVLDAETARRNGGSLLNVNHPLVQSAMAAPSHRDRRFACVTIENSSIRPGRYLVLLAVGTWSGLRPSAEFWTESLDLETERAVDDSVGSAFFSALSQNALRDAALPGHDLAALVPKLERRMERRRQAEDQERRRENESFVLERQLRAKATLDRKRHDFEQRIEKGGGAMRSAFEGQIRRAEYKYNDELQRIEESKSCGLDLESVAVLVLEVCHE